MKFYCIALSFFCALLPVFGTAPAVEKAYYDGTQVVRVPPTNNSADVTTLLNIIQALELNTWTEHVANDVIVDVMVPAEKVSAFAEAMTGRAYTVMHEDLGASIKAESEPATVLERDGALPGDLTWFNSYHSYDDHMEWLEQLHSQHLKNTVLFNIGTSYEGRNITGIHIYTSRGKGVRPAVVFHGTTHAREWISTMVVEYLIYALLNNNSAIEENGVLDKYDYYILPIVNPDGFVYTQTADRLWKKNRQPNAGSPCIGVDQNRNWNYQWDATNGASPDPCDHPGSSPETAALAAFNELLAGSFAGVKLYMDWQSYGQLVMTPYGYACDKLPPTNTELQALAKGYADAVASVNGVKFGYGPICATLYPESGSSVDYTYDVSHFPYSFAVELRDTGGFGFVLPPDQILPSCLEAWAGVQYLLSTMRTSG